MWRRSEQFAGCPWIFDCDGRSPPSPWRRRHPSMLSVMRPQWCVLQLLRDLPRSVPVEPIPTPKNGRTAGRMDIERRSATWNIQSCRDCRAKWTITELERIRNLPFGHYWWRAQWGSRDKLSTASDVMLMLSSSAAQLSIITYWQSTCSHTLPEPRK